MKVLIADDSAFMREVLRDIVASLSSDVEIVEAQDGGQALDICAKQSPDLLLLDLIMPEKNGIDVLRTIGDSVPVLVISATGHDHIVQEAMTLGAKQFITKPFEVDDVKKAIQSCISLS